MPFLPAEEGGEAFTNIIIYFLLLLMFLHISRLRLPKPVIGCLRCFLCSCPCSCFHAILHPYCCAQTGASNTRVTKRVPNRSRGKHMDLEDIPAELRGLAQVEEMLIDRAAPILTSAYCLKGSQRGYMGVMLQTSHRMSRPPKQVCARVHRRPHARRTP